MLESLAIDALSSIGRSLRTSQAQASAPAAQAANVPITGFDTIMGQLANDGMTALKAGETASISGLQGRASAQQVVDAMMSAERSLQLAVAVRDKVVQAYQELTRMAI
jgi:flagellar hook-basal body complex protein FliE